MTRTLQLDHVQFEIFSDLDFREEDGTLVVHASDSDMATLRCSVTSIYQMGEEVHQVAESEIPRLAEKGKGQCQVIGEKFLFRTHRASSDDSRDTVHYWYLGLGGHIAIITVFVDHRSEDDARAKRLMDCADLLVQTFQRVT
jgi:hypothetical protein